MRLFFGISLAILLAFTTAATPETEGVPEDGILSFDIVRNGSSIGTHTYRFDQYDGRTEVRITGCSLFRYIGSSTNRTKSGKTAVFPYLNQIRMRMARR